MADLASMEGDLPGALAYLEQALRNEPQNSDLANRTGRARLRVQEGRVDSALASGDEATAIHARRALEAARVVEFRRQVAQNPTDLRLRFALGQALVAVGDFDDAIAELQQGVRDPKVKGEALQLLGEAFAAKGMGDLALGQFAKALEVVSDTGQKGKEILYAMGCVAQNTGQLDQALAHFSRIMEQDIGFKDVRAKVDALRSPS
jgi:tetratricopeptide (TPR) repeat protein